MLKFRPPDLETNQSHQTYCHYDLPVFTHAENDPAMMTGQFCVNGHVTEVQISRIFGVPLMTVKRAVKRFRDEGVKGFYAKKNTRGAAVLTEPVLIEAQRLPADECQRSCSATGIEKRHTRSKLSGRDGCTNSKKSPDR